MVAEMMTLRVEKGRKDLRTLKLMKESASNIVTQKKIISNHLQALTARWVRQTMSHNLTRHNLLPLGTGLQLHTSTCILAHQWLLLLSILSRLMETNKWCINRWYPQPPRECISLELWRDLGLTRGRWSTSKLRCHNNMTSTAHPWQVRGSTQPQ